MARLLRSPGPTRLVSSLLWLQLATSFLVMREPGPCDVIFPLAALAVVGGNHMVPLGRVPKPVLLGAFVLAVTNMLGLFWAEDRGDAVRYGFITLYMIALLLVLAVYVGRYGLDAARSLERAFLFAATAASSIGLLARFQLLPASHLFFRDESGLRIKSTFKDPNVFAPFVVGALLLLLARIVEDKRLRTRDLGMLGICGAGVLLAFSRGAWAHLALSGAVFCALHLCLIRNPRSIRRLMLGGIGAVIAMVPGVLIILSRSKLSGYFMERLSLQSYDTERFSNQDSAIEMAMTYPLGLGPGMWDAPRQMATHNVYIRILVENGVFGLIAFGLLCLGAILAGLAVVRRRGPEANFAAACIGVSVGILGESVIIDTLHWRHLFVFLALPLGLAIHRSTATIRSSVNTERELEAAA